MKPTIYLGLGGTGNLAVSHAKKLYEEEHGTGNIPSSVAFVTVDFQTDMDSDPGLSTSISDNFIKIEAATNPREFYRVRRDEGGEYTWMFDSNTSNIDNRISKGAKAVRTTGRLYTEMVLESIINRLSNTVNNVTVVDTDDEYDVSGGVNIHMVMSVAGGTGAGSFITIANAIRQKWGNHVNLYGYGVTHSVFRAMDVSGNKTPNVELNAISSIIDLDYLMTASESNPIPLEMGTRKIMLKEPIFDGFYVVDNTSESGHTLKTVKALCEVIGTCLYACGVEAGDKVENVINNVGPKEGKHHVGSKLGWVQGLGACQVVYKGELLAKTYGLKAAMELIRKMRQEGVDIQKQALDWTQEVSIREDGDEYNMLIDSIYSPKSIQGIKAPMVDQSLTEAANIETIKKYMVSTLEFPVEETLRNRAEDLKTMLRDKVAMYLKSESGVGNSIKFLNSLQRLCEKYRGEMEEEVRSFNVQKDERNESFETKAFRDYNDQKHGRLTINRATKNQDLLDDIVGRPAKEILKLNFEIKRREAARDIFISLLGEIAILSQKMTDLDQKLANLVDKYETELTQIQSQSADALVFEYDLSYDERINMSVASEDIVVADFIDGLGRPLTEIGIGTELNNRILEYAENLPQAQLYKEKLITEVVDNLSDEDYKKLKSEIRKKSARWLRINSRGQRVNSGDRKSVEDAIAKNWMVSIYKPDSQYKSRLDRDESFLQNVESKDFLYVDKDVAKQRMLFCRIDGSMIPYCIGVFDDMAMDRYNTQLTKARGGDRVYHPHFDKHLFEKMRQEDFKLKPEMKNESIFYWVCGHFFGWETIKEDERIMNKDEKGVVLSEGGKELADHLKYICCLRKKYMYWDVDAPAGKDRQWKPLGNTGRRDTAYNEFKTVILPEHKENFKSIITEVYSQKVAFWRNEIQRVIDAGFEDYIDRIVCSDKSSVTYFSKESGEVKQLQDEFQYIKNDLLNALDNLK